MLSLIIGGVGIALGLANFVNGTIRSEESKSKLEALKAKLDSLSSGQADIIGRLKIVLIEIKWTEIIIEVSDAINNIEYQYSQIMLFKAGETKTANKWAEGVLSPTNGVGKNLFTINNIMMGKSILSEPIMKTFINKITESTTTQSQYYEAISFFNSVADIETKALVVIANAYAYINNTDDKSKIKKHLENEGLTSIITDQAVYNKPFVEQLNQWYQSKSWGSNCYSVHGDNHYVDTNKNLAPNDNVITGLSLYLKGNRMGLKIMYSPINPDGQVSTSQITTQKSPGWGKNCFNLNDDHYVDTNIVQVDNGYVATGAQLYLKGNRVAIKLQGAPYNTSTYKIDNSQKKWFESHEWGKNVFSTDGDDHYVHLGSVNPNPTSFTTGAAFFLYGNRIALKINTCFYDLPTSKSVETEEVNNMDNILESNKINNTINKLKNILKEEVEATLNNFCLGQNKNH